jgi:hypothetical protein
MDGTGFTELRYEGKPIVADFECHLCGETGHQVERWYRKNVVSTEEFDVIPVAETALSCKNRPIDLTGFRKLKNG